VAEVFDGWIADLSTFPITHVLVQLGPRRTRVARVLKIGPGAPRGVETAVGAISSRGGVVIERVSGEPRRGGVEIDSEVAASAAEASLAVVAVRARHARASNLGGVRASASHKLTHRAR
jgi:hypothetical protein